MQGLLTAAVLLLPLGLGAETYSFNPRIPSADKILSTLRKEHPRIIAGREDFTRLKELVENDPLARKWYASLLREAQSLLKAKPSTYRIPDGLRLLATSRRVLHRVYTLALTWRLERKREFAERAWRELEAASRFPDWNPRHFLDTAEMSHAFGIGYDWLYDYLSPERRKEIRRALVEKGLLQALECYRGKARFGWWVRSEHNWNQVCNGGIGIGGIALADEEPELVSELLSKGLSSLRRPSTRYAPDGAWAEGPGYWNYATSYHVCFLAALRSALGTDFGFSKAPGFEKTGLFPVYLTGPSGRTFNFADAGAGTVRAPQFFWFAREFHLPVCAWYERKSARPVPLDLIWYTPEGADPAASGLPEAAYFRRVEVAAFRSAWEDSKAVFVGFKAGDNKVNHSHLDLGSFVLEAAGERWAVDLGADNYNLPGYFGGKRWNYYRLRAEGHNTLVIGPGKGPDQNPRAAAPIIRFSANPRRMYAIADLTRAYSPRATSVFRGIALEEKRRVIVQDEISTPRECEVFWFLHTKAQITLKQEGRIARLSLGNAELRARLLEPADAAFEVRKAEPLPSSPHEPRQRRNAQVRKLTIRLQGVGNVRVAVELTPEPKKTGGPGSPAAIKPLREWK